MMHAARWMAIFATVSLLSACGSGITGLPQPSGGPSAAASRADGDAGLPNSGVPKVMNPLSPAQLGAATHNTCSLLSSSQVRTLGLSSPGDPKPASTGPSCEWSNLDSGASAGILFPNKIVYRGLSQYYEDPDSAHGGHFDQLDPIEGFPAISSGTGNVAETGSCEVQIGLTDRDVVQVGISVSRSKLGKLSPCAAAYSVAKMVVSNIRKV